MKSVPMTMILKHCTQLLLAAGFVSSAFAQTPSTNGVVPVATLEAATPITIDLSKRTWQGIPGLERTAKGRVFATWFTGGLKEPSPDNTVVLSRSDDGGKTFTPPEAMGLPLSDGTRTFDPTLWIDPKGRLWYIFNRGNKEIAKHDVWARICNDPDATPPVFGAEFRVGYDVPFAFRMNKVTVLSSGEWLMPVTLAEKPVRDWCTGYNDQQTPTLHGVGISTDEGRNWQLHGAVKSRPWALENMITELKDGRLWMLIRTSSGVLWESHSSDKGRTWSEGSASTIKSPGSRFFIRRLASGNLLLVNHHKFTGRSHLTAQLSTDDGVTWTDGLLLDERSNVSYPDGVQDKDGLVWITYDRDRNGTGDILLAKFREEDVLAGKNISGSVTLQQVIHKLDKSHPVHAAAPSLQPPQHLGLPRADQAVTNRAFTGIPSMATAPKGRLWAAWYAGVTPAEDLNNYVVLSTSGDNGTTWQEVLTVDPDAGGPVRSFDPELWVSPDGRLFFFWAQMEKGRRDTELGVWCIETNEPDATNPTWSGPRRIGDGVMMCKPLTLSSGEWVLPISKWKGHDNSAQMIVSNDQGKNWSLRGGCNVPGEVRQFDEHMFVERKDGSLWLLVRTTYGIGESVSTDGGKTWPELKPSGILHTPSRFFIRRLVSKNLLLVKHGPLDTRTSRSHLTAYISKDDGHTWIGGLMLDERLGVSYPDGQQTADGLIRIIYDYNRVSDRNVLMAAFREEDVAAGKDVSGAVKLRQIVSKATGGQEKVQTSTAPVHTNADDKALRTTQHGTLTSERVTPQALVPGAKLFTDRAYLSAELPAALKNAHFLPIPMNGQKSVKCERAGTVFFLTPVLERNRDNAAQALMDQGFEKVALPEIPLFNPASSNNFSTLFQKDCVSGETILIGKWAVPVFFP